MSYRPLKNLSAGELQELTLLEEDYLAFQAGVALGQMDSSESSALTRLSGGNLIGSYTDTSFAAGEVDSITVFSFFLVSIFFFSSRRRHTISLASGGLPETLYVDDIIEINVSGTATSTGNGFETIGYSLITSGDATFTSTVTETPTATIVNDTEAIWQDFVDPTLSGSFDATIRLTLTDVGALNLTFQANSLDNQNSTNTAVDTQTYSTINVEQTRPPNTIEVVTNLYQNTPDNAPIQTSGLNKRNPVYWRKNSGKGVKEMSDAALDILCTRLIEKIVANELPGSFRLSTDSPGLEWEVFLEDIFQDTRGGLPVNSYSIWIKTSGIAPSQVNPVSIFRQNNIFAGLRAMTDAQMQFTFGERVKKIIGEGGVGSYQLRSS